MIAELIFHWAKHTPGQTAVIHNGNNISYALFAHTIAQARGYFARRGQLGPGLALIVDDNLMNFWILALALQSLGFTTAIPRDDVADWLGSPDLRCVVTTPAAGIMGLDRLCAARGIALLSVSLDAENPMEPEAGGIRHPAAGHILTTSGTTGSYKKVRISAAADAAYLQRTARATGVTQDSVFCVFRFPPSSGVGYRWAASAWVVGGTTLIEQRDRAYEALFRPGLTHAGMFPGLLATALAGAAFRCNPGLQLYVGGGAMSRSQVAEAKTRITPNLFNVLASTEAGIIAVTRLDTPDDLHWQRILPGCQVEIVDEHNRLLPAGQTGRVRVKTEGEPTGYLHDEAATRDLFRDGFFYSGDLGVIRSDGRLALEGRVTEVINQQGIKTPAAPIENELSKMFAADGVCVFSGQNTSGEEELHIVIGALATLESEKLISAISAGIGGFSRANIYFAASLPRSPTGKILREHVRAQAFARQPDIVVLYDENSGKFAASRA